MRAWKAGVVFALAAVFSFGVSAQSWVQVGPPGGDVRSLVADPRDARVLYLGTSDGHVFTSTDGANHWRQLGRVGTPDTVVFTLTVDRRNSKNLFAGTWSLGRGRGGAWRSTDGGETWKPAGLDNQNVRAIVQAPSDDELLYAATLDGVYRSRDDGHKWERISPTGHADLLNFDSLAVDPGDPNVVYAGTYHLAWKTVDGGKHWSPIHAGMIDDSDVMSIVLDRNNPDRVFATACSGMYRSGERGERWTKIQGIPFVSRRTHFIRQDPVSPNVFYAGTTQGLWKSTDDSMTWTRVTRPDWSIIGLVTDPKRPGRLVVGLERRGIVVSEDGGNTYHSANNGFNHQQTFLFAMDSAHPERMLLVLTNSAEAVRTTEDGGRIWRSLGPGLKPELTHSVYAPAGEWWAALQSGGLLRYDAKLGKWQAAGVMQAAKSAPPAKGKKAAPAKALAFKERVLDMDFSSTRWYAATRRGLFVSANRGGTWAAASVGSEKSAEILSVRVSPDGNRISVLSKDSLLISSDAGKTWGRSAIPPDVRGDMRLHDAGGALFIASDSGLYSTRDSGQRWQAADIQGRRIEGFASVEDTLLVSTSSGLHVSYDRGHRWAAVPNEEAEGRFPFLVRAGSETIVAASATEGLHSVTLTTAVSGNRAPAAARETNRPGQVPRQQP